MFLMREDDKLILRGVAADFQRLQGWVGVVFVLLGLWATGGSWYASQLAFLVLSVPLIVFGGFLLSRHRTVTTIFDLPSRRVIFTITTSVGWGWYQRSYTYSYSFDEIAGIGVTGGLWGEDGVTVLYSPVMKLRDGQNCWLPNGGSASNRRSRRLAYLQYAEPLAAICAATGLQKLDLIPRRAPPILESRASPISPALFLDGQTSSRDGVTRSPGFLPAIR
jgi:hypothetical protein